jgi:hypothetical protein
VKRGSERQYLTLGSRKQCRSGHEETASGADLQAVNYIPQSKAMQRPVERLIKLGQKKDRLVNYLVIEAIMECLDREEKVR